MSRTGVCDIAYILCVKQTKWKKTYCWKKSNLGEWNKMYLWMKMNEFTLLCRCNKEHSP